jgi:predicted RNA methylase
MEYDNSSDSSGDSGGDFNDWDSVDADENKPYVSLLHPESLIQDQAKVYEELYAELGFDFSAFKKKHNDSYKIIRLINAIRLRVKENSVSTLSVFLKEITENDSHPVWIDEVYLMPVLSDDKLIMDAIEMDENDNENDGETNVHSTGDGNLGSKSEYLDKLEQELEHANRLLKLTIDEGIASEKDPQKKDNDTYYFESYDDIGIHFDMLRDKSRSNAYCEGISTYKHLFENKIVLDIGCGTGVLSIFAARAGAKHVFAIDASNIIHEAIEIIKENGFSSKITCVKGKVEEIDLISVFKKQFPSDNIEKADIIISEWMGYALLYESMLSSVLYVRDKFLQLDSGHMFPSVANLFCFAVNSNTIYDHKLKFWEDVYGIQMSRMKKYVHQEAQIMHLQKEDVASSMFLLRSFSLIETKDSELDLVKLPFNLKIEQNQVEAGDDDVSIHGIGIWFDVLFNDRFDKNTSSICLSTSPSEVQTHWSQTMLMFSEPLRCKRSETLSGYLSMLRNDVNPRTYRYILELNQTRESEPSTMHFSMK